MVFKISIARIGERKLASLLPRGAMGRRLEQGEGELEEDRGPGREGEVA